MDQFLIPAEKLIHMTATYSNVVLLAVLTNVSDFAQKLGLPIPQPITVAQVQAFKPSPIKGALGGVLTLTNGDRFFQHHGYIDLYYGYNNFLTAPPDIENGSREQLEQWAESLFGPVNMTTNEVIAFARDALRKLGYDPAVFSANRPPTRFHGPGRTPAGKPIPFCRVEWNYPDLDDIVQFEINVNRKEVVGFSLVSTNAWRPDPKLEIEPELEADYRKRVQGTMFIRTNTPSRPPQNSPPPRTGR